jgi:hypothetical protein
LSARARRSPSSQRTPSTSWSSDAYTDPQTPALLRSLRAGQHPRIHPGQPVITIGATDELTVLRAYESGSDHHLPDSTGYVLLRAVLASVLRRTVDRVTS